MFDQLSIDDVFFRKALFAFLTGCVCWLFGVMGVNHFLWKQSQGVFLSIQLEEQHVRETLNVGTYWNKRERLQKKIEELELQSREQQAQLQTLRSVVGENVTLKAMFATGEKPQEWVPTHLITASGQHILFVGSDASVGIDAPVVSHGNVIGQVSGVEKDRSFVTFLTDEGTAWGVVHSLSGEKGVLRFENGVAQVQFLDRVDTIHSGDDMLLLPSGTASPLPIGTIDRITTHANDPVTDVTLHLEGFPLLDALVFVGKKGVQ
ncbi:hypothetical protein C5B42_03635 [Candidatus Cerribacteria bacterium 'Amazon FNV 2010 28 9']|uniref:Rod shape-determining protein MreC beta-barrel core domain-containing protein n=1 Tax=Candidatus Cerribacteria bacterium 'Amazon FNV 2010 28 9' TaxID=2081795 RepID=A0A317JNI3_9BACT|nr:MAG: hypothetical protein C5B42_03635 [Candidatus Cerribacteria bacterium 'Amazon FNV 2010 28 9']